VREFTSGAGQACPNTPIPMDDTETDFITKMILDEVMELMATRYGPAEAKQKMIDMITQSKDIPKEDFSAQPTKELQDLHMCAAQVDALVDVYYYSQNAACKKGFNMSAVFDIVHGANMAKRDPATGQFIKRADGKIIKPAGWKAPDVEGEMVRQGTEGSFVPL
jgi:predicted HAD superfamily Cof-like phosphohydrolase